MARTLKISVGQHSDRGRKPVNQDFHGVSVPKEPLLGSKGIAIALADGIGSSEVSQTASEFAVAGFLDDYYCTSDAWSVKKSVERVLAATNSWLHSRTQQSQYRYDKDRGYVCTLSALVLKSATAHVFHVGDSRVGRLRAGTFEQITQDHRIWVSHEQSYLSRAMGFNPQVDIDYRALPLELGDVFVLMTDGVHEHVEAGFLTHALAGAAASPSGELDQVAREIAEEALRSGSPDNLTVQVLRIDELPDGELHEVYEQLSRLPLPPMLEARMVIDGYRIVRKLHGSHRSHLYLAVEAQAGELVCLKTPSVDQRGHAPYLERFLMEEWVARRIDSPHVLKPCRQTRERTHLYVATEFIDGQTLAQWLIDHPRPAFATVRGIVAQIAKGLQAFHRLEMLHQDLRPENIMIDRTGTVKIIDFGAVRVAGIAEMARPGESDEILGTLQYAAPEYFLGEPGTWQSDLFSLGVLTYQMLSGRLPYGTEVAKTRTRAAQKLLRYDSVLDDERDIPAWIDGVLRKAVQPDPLKRHESLSEYVHDLHHPNQAFLDKARPPLVERHPVLFWKALSVVLAGVVLLLLMLQFGRR